MALALGQKAKLVTLLDNKAADELIPMYSIEINLERSPEQRVKCGAIVVFRLNTVDLNLEKALRTPEGQSVSQTLREMQDEVNKQTSVMHMDPIYFKETEGRWVGWALDRALELYDQLGSAKIIVKSARLRIRQERSSREIASMRSDPRKLFEAAWGIDALLDKGYAYDPWTQSIRRGRISAEASKR